MEDIHTPSMVIQVAMLIPDPGRCPHAVRRNMPELPI